IGGFWSRHTPKTPPFILPIRNLSHVQGFPVQHSLNSKMSGTEGAGAKVLTRHIAPSSTGRLRGGPAPHRDD
ncbi:hypothetical protein, partial [Deinococcus radiopugnans]|uniref:hypothetical protein n=1 Tax=Deinococcus radiopugnans TaxID=57497 RepID=UPI001B86D2EB